MRFCFLPYGLMALLAGCAPQSPPAGPASSGPAGETAPQASNPANGKKFRIAVIPKGTTHVFWKSVHLGAENAAKEIGNVEILWKGSALEKDTAGQIQVVQDFIAQKVDGIVLAPLESQALVEYVDQAVEQSIPVVIFDSALDKEDKIVSYVATDNRKGGELAARRLAETLNGKGHVVLVRYNQGSESTYQREEGFLECLKRDFPDVTVLSSDRYIGTTREEAMQNATLILQQHQQEINGIFAVCEPNAMGVLRALEETTLAGKVKFVAFDPDPELIQGMTSGKVDGIVLQDPVTMGYMAVKTMLRHLNGESVEKRIGTGEYVATPDNMLEPDMKKLLNPPRFGE